MKKLLCTVLCLGGLFSACASHNAAVQPAREADGVSSGVSSDRQQEPAPVRIDVAHMAPEDALKQAAAVCAPLISGLQIPQDSRYRDLTGEEKEAFLDCIAAAGAPVIAYGYDMRNYEQVEAFGEAVARGETAQTGIFVVSENGLRLDTLAQNQGRQMRVLTSSYFPCTEVIGGTLEEITGIGLRDGYLMYGEPDPDSRASLCGGYRVTPLGPEKRDACFKYVEPVFGSQGKLVGVDWDEDNLTGLDMQAAFESLYQMDTGISLYDAAYPQNPQNFTYAVPGLEVERIMMKYLPVTVEDLRRDGRFDGTSYHWGCFEGGGYCPVPEVTDIQKKDDGSLVLTVCAAAVEFGQPQAASYLLTVQPGENGAFRYLSCRVLSIDW